MSIHDQQRARLITALEYKQEYAKIAERTEKDLTTLRAQEERT